MGRFRIAVALAVASCLRVACRAEPASAAIDQRPELEVGDYRVSHYLVDKYYGRFADGIMLRQHRTVSAAETKAWLDLFVAQQIIIAHENSVGQATRPEIVSTVAHMERNMLTQASGPFYRALLDREPALAETELKELYEKVGNVIEAVVARFPDETEAVKWLGADFDGVPTDEQTRRIMQCRDQDGVLLVSSVFSWPFLPFSEVADVLEAAPAAHWIRHHKPGFGEYYILVRNRRRFPAGDWRTAQHGFRTRVAEMRQVILRQRRQVQLLRAAAFSMEQATAARLLDHCRIHMTGRYEIPAISAKAVAAEPLFRYRIGTEMETVTAEEFRQHFNEQYVRTPVREMPDLRREAENMALEELDCRAARAQGVDRTPQFTEDRFGFTGLQVLDFFERETLVPKINIQPSEIERYYTDHESEFRQTTRIRGRLMEFETLDKACTWRSQMEPGGGSSLLPRANPVSDREIEVASNEPVSGLEAVQGLLFECPEGTTIGPLQRGQSYVCFVKERNLEVGARPIDGVASTIRGILVRQALDSEELRLAADLSRNIEVKIDRSDFLARTANPTLTANP